MHSWLYGYYSTYQVVPNTRIQCTSSSRDGRKSRAALLVTHLPVHPKTYPYTNNSTENQQQSHLSHPPSSKAHALATPVYSTLVTRTAHVAGPKKKKTRFGILPQQ